MHLCVDFGLAVLIYTNDTPSDNAILIPIACDATSSLFNFLISADVKTCRRLLIVQRLGVFRMMVMRVGDFVIPRNFANQVSTTLVPQRYQRKQSAAQKRTRK